MPDDAAKEGPASGGTLTAASSLSDLIAHEAIHLEAQEESFLKEAVRPLHEYETDLRASRPGFLNFLKGLGVNKLKDRQRVANVLSQLLRERRSEQEGQLRISEMPPGEWVSDVALPADVPKHERLPVEAPPRAGCPVVLKPDDPNLWYTPFNWLVTGTALDGEPGAIAVCPGAYMLLSWEGEYTAPVALVLDTKSAQGAFLSLGCSLDGGETVVVQVPHGGLYTTVTLPLLTGSGEPEPCVDSAGIGGAVRERHQLRIQLHNSKQKNDRWGDKGRLPACSLRIRKVHLPPRSTAVAPRLRPLRLLALGDSIVEGVGAHSRKHKLGDLDANAADCTWVAHVAKGLDAEHSSVGYGRQGWTVPANGNVPPAASASASVTADDPNCSWNKLWADCPRHFAATGGPHVDFVLLAHGTCDGLIVGEPCADAVRLGVSGFLPRLRAAVGPHTVICICIPFGGFGGRSPPKAALIAAYNQYARSSGDPFTLLLQFDEGAARNLGGFQFNPDGSFASSRESFDGIHPLAARHAELGALALSQLQQRLSELPPPAPTQATAPAAASDGASGEDGAGREFGGNGEAKGIWRRQKEWRNPCAAEEDGALVKAFDKTLDAALHTMGGMLASATDRCCTVSPGTPNDHLLKQTNPSAILPRPPISKSYV